MKSAPGEFMGFTEDTYRFFVELMFNNNRDFFLANKQRYERVVKQPMHQLAAVLEPVMRAMDEDFNFKPGNILSRISRDTRFSDPTRPYRDHAWLGYRYPNTMLSESFCVYFEIEPDSYGWGMGMYNANPTLMKKFRARILADPAGFLALANAPELRRYHMHGEPFKRDRFPNAPEEIKPYLNRKGMGWGFTCPDVRRTFSPELQNEVLQGMKELTPLYRFLMK